MIYHGILAVSRDPALRAFASHHLATEQRHLADIEKVVPKRWRSRLLPLWRLSGWLTGALPAFVGARATYATIQAVETFVDRHYAEQVTMIDEILALEASGPEDEAPRPGFAALRDLLERCRLDEVEHRDDAADRWDGSRSALMAAWQALVGHGSKAAVGVCRYL
jgi:ubiquinone biosynthesis monooxygenase Coq7